jgi:hypothetical protein
MSEPFTSPRMVALFETTRPQLQALSEAIAPHVTRRPATPVAPMVEADARAVLAAVRRVLSREPGQRGRLELRGSPNWAELGAKLALADSGLGAFRRRYHGWDDVAGDYLWRTEDLPTCRPAAPSTFLARAAQLDSQLTALAERL